MLSWRHEVPDPAMPHARVLDNTRLFAAKVMPRFR
jgi:hypothetical protein